MEIVIARPEQLDAIVALTERAQAAMAALRLDQWQNGYPNRAVWEADIAAGGAYAALDEGRVAGMMRYCTGPDPSYATIDGAWLTDGPYAAIHRLAVDPDLRGRGLAGTLLAFACEKAAAEGLASVRIDTHADNVPMQRALAKAGFARCGTVTLAEGLEAGAPRLAYERALSPTA